MPVTVKADWEAGATSADGAELVYNVHGAADDFEAWEAVRVFSVPIYLGFLRGNFKVTRDGPNLYKARVPYGPPGTGGSDVPVGEPVPPAETGGSGAPPTTDDGIDGTFTFDFSLGDRHITQGIGTICATRRGDPFGGGTAPFFGGVIGVSKTADGTVSIGGADIPEASFAWTKKVARKTVNANYYNTLEATVGKLNAATFYYKRPRTQLLAGVSGRHLRGKDYALEFRFLGKPVVVPSGGSKQIAPAAGAAGPLMIHAVGVDQDITGWDTIWVLHDMYPAVGLGMAMQPSYAYVERTIETADFTLLRI